MGDGLPRLFRKRSLATEEWASRVLA